jgi:phosphomevalonate kinase
MGDKPDSLSMLTDIYREVGETKVTVENLSKKMEGHIDHATLEFRRINELDNEQNRILDKHIEGVNTLKDMHLAHRMETHQQIELLKQSVELQKKESDARIQALEKPYDLVKFAGKVIVWVAGVAGALAGLLKLFGGL